jgi:hypothetical protein
VGLFDNGVIGLRNNRIVTHLTAKQGLTSNNIRSLFVQNDRLWVGTDKGLNEIITRPRPQVSTRITTADGLVSNLINCIYAEADTIFIGTPEGLTYFNIKSIATQSKCKLKILSVVINDKASEPTAYYSLPAGSNTIQIDFAGISQKSAGEMLYRYRMLGIDDTWRSLDNNTVKFVQLPPGHYVLELVAINKFGTQSGTERLVFDIAAPFWRSAWFIVLMMGLLALLIRTFIRYRLRRLRALDAEKMATQQRINELEQSAIRAQMNPHFIFNCLNSIQQFIIGKDLQAANHYLSAFAHLIRQTMNNSLQQVLSVRDELKYLSTYLQMEQMRFSEKFSYTIDADPELDTDNTYLPTMILQPYVENSIRHGIRNLPGNEGLLRISIRQEGDELVCTVADNGVGRQKAQELKSEQHIEYQSRGMQLTAQRIELINKSLTRPIRIRITDLYDEAGNAAGTAVTVHIPIELTDKYHGL